MEHDTLGRREDLGWAMLSAAGCAFAVKAAQAAFDEIHQRIKARKERKKNDESKPGKSDKPQ